MPSAFSTSLKFRPAAWTPISTSPGPGGRRVDGTKLEAVERPRRSRRRAGAPVRRSALDDRRRPGPAGPPAASRSGTPSRSSVRPRAAPAPAGRRPPRRRPDPGRRSAQRSSGCSSAMVRPARARAPAHRHRPGAQGLRPAVTTRSRGAPATRADQRLGQRQQAAAARAAGRLDVGAASVLRRVERPAVHDPAPARHHRRRPRRRVARRPRAPRAAPTIGERRAGRKSRRRWRAPPARRAASSAAASASPTPARSASTSQRAPLTRRGAAARITVFAARPALASRSSRESWRPRPRPSSARSARHWAGDSNGPPVADRDR